jgi:predicted nucleic acid-binding protein
VIYIDTSVALAHLLAEDIHPPDELWQDVLVSSRLLEYELWVRVNARKLAQSHGEVVRNLVGRLALLELVPPVLSRALEPVPIPVRTLDALHLASFEFLQEQGHAVELLTYDQRMLEAARKMRVPVSPFSARVPPSHATRPDK